MQPDRTERAVGSYTQNKYEKLLTQQTYSPPIPYKVKQVSSRANQILVSHDHTNTKPNSSTIKIAQPHNLEVAATQSHTTIQNKNEHPTTTNPNPNSNIQSPKIERINKIRIPHNKITRKQRRESRLAQLTPKNFFKQIL